MLKHSRIQRLFDVRDDVLGILDAYGEADEIGAHAGFDELLVRQLAMRVAGGVQHAGAGIGHVGDDGGQLQVIHEADGHVASAFQTERDDAARTVGHIFLRQFIIFVVFQSAIIDPCYLLVVVQIFGHFLGVFAVLAIVFFLCTFKWTRERVTPVNEAGSSLKDDLKDLLRNRAWWVLLSAGIAAVIFNSIRDGAAVYYFKYYVGNDPAWLAGTGLSLTTLFLVSGQAANILGILLVTPVSGRIGKKNTFFGSMAIAGILSLVFMSVGKDAVWLMLLLQILISMCAGSIFPLLWSMYADIADYSELKTGRRATGLIFSSSSMSQKFGWALGGTLSGWLLAHYGFQANMVQDEAVLGGIRSMMGILPAVACAVSSLCVAFYPLSEKKVLETSRRLAALRDAGKHFEGE